jgi:phosphate transport system substrate-binding protein
MDKVLFILIFISIIACQIKKMSFKELKRHKITGLFPGMVLSMAGIMLFSSCGNQGTKVLDETPTRGNIKIAVDESFQPLLDTEVFTFTHLYTSANVTPLYKPEFDVIEDYMNDSVKVIVTSKKLTDYQIQYLRESQTIARTTTFAYDALALVTNRDNKDTLIKYETIKDIFAGKIKSWKDINPKSKIKT